jgi:UDP-glucuronate 4-epimerase
MWTTVVEAIERLIDQPAKANTASGDGIDPAQRAVAPWRIYNIGNNNAVEISRVVALLERELGRKAKTELAPMQPGDAAVTWADSDDLAREIGFRPSTPIDEGIARFVAWFREYHTI